MPVRNGTPSPRNSQEAPARTGHLLFYAALSVLCLLMGFGLLFLMVWKAQMLASLGLTGKLFYVALVPVGLSAAGFLFGVLQSVATYRGEKFGGTLVLGGPIIAAALTVWGGFALPPPDASTFSTTVFVHGPGGPQDMLLQGQGQVVMDLHGNRRSEGINDKGAAYFPGIPGDLRGQEVPVSVVAPGFERADREPRKLAGESIYLPVRRRASRLFGIVQAPDGAPVEDAAIDVEGLSTKTDAAGRFDLLIAGDGMKPEMDLKIDATGFVPESHTVVPGGSEIRIRLGRRKK
jgi:hypothetical protein